MKIHELTESSGGVIKIADSAKIGQSVQLSVGNNAQLIIEEDVEIVGRAKIVLLDGASLIVGKHASLKGTSIRVNIGGVLEIGLGTTIKSGKLRTGINRRIKIGNDCMFSWDVTMLGSDAHMIYDVDSGKCINNAVGDVVDSIIIEDHVWLGMETCILPNTKIGVGSICGGRSVCKGTFGNNVVIAGNPGKVIKRNIAWSRSRYSYNNDFDKIPQEYRKRSQLT